MGLIQTVKQIFATFTETAAPANPDAGDQRLYIDPADHKLKRINSSGTVVTIEGGAGGTTGSTDNAVLRADGTGGSTMQSSLATVDDSGTVNIPTGQTYNINNTPHTHGASGAAITESAYASPPSTPADGDQWLVTDGHLLLHRASSAWTAFGPIHKLTLPPAIAGQATTLNNGGTVGIGDVSLVVTSASGFPVAPFYILIESELILVGAKSGTTFSSLTRGYNGTSAATHADGTAVTLQNWAWANQGTSTLTQTYGPSIMQSQLNAGQTLRALHRPAPATPYTVTALITHENPETAGGSGWGAGIGFRENSSGKYLFFGSTSASNGWGIDVMRWAATNSYTSSYKTTTNNGLMRPMWLQINDDGTNLVYRASLSGLPGTFLQFYTNLRGNYFASGPDGIAMLLYQENNSIQSTGTFWSWVVS